MKRGIFIFSCITFVILSFIFISHEIVTAEQSGSSPESGADSRLKDVYDFLVGKGANYGASASADWTESSWGSYWDRITDAAAWEPGGTATAALVPSGLTFYAGDGDRTIKTGTLFTSWENQDYDDSNCTNNNGETATACGAGDSEYTGEEGTWTLVASGGTAASVTDNSVTLTLTSNKVYKDDRTGLYWSDKATSGTDNEFVFIDGDSRSSPAGNSCNFTSTGTANAYCDNQDPLAAYTEDNDVSASDFCLNLSLDGDNADGDSNGATGTETDWRLPTQKELLVAYVNGAGNNLPNAAFNLWSSTESASSQSNAMYVQLQQGVSSSISKATTSIQVMCVRRP